MSKYVPIHLVPYFLHSGCDVECDGYYNSEKQIINSESPELSHMYTSLGYHPKFTSKNVPDGCLPSLMKKDVKDWLREVKNIHFYVYPKVVGRSKPILYRWTVLSPDLICNNLIEYVEFEDAFEKALEFIASLNLKEANTDEGLFI